MKGGSVAAYKHDALDTHMLLLICCSCKQEADIDSLTA
jgi:hypothetical protein